MLPARLLARFGAAVLLLGSVVVAAAPAAAATITVNTTADELNSDGDCGMREAIQAANTNTSVDACGPGVGADTINVPFGTFQLSLTGSGEDGNQTGDLDIHGDVTIVGAGASTAVNALGSDRGFDVHSGTVTIQALKVQNGSASGGAGPGGNILNHATLTISNVTVEDGTSNAGGGIYNAPSGTLTLSNSSLVGAPAGNMAVLGGGLNNDGNATVTNTTISGSTVTAGGGGIFNNGTMSITGATITANDGGNGGGILNGANGTLSLATTNITNNTADDHAGVANDGTLTITNGTVISGNAATGGGCGGGLWNTGDLTADDVTIDANTHGCGAGFSNRGNATLTNSLVSNNIAAFNGGGIDNNGSLTIDDSAISGNTAGFGGGGILNGGNLTLLANSAVSGNTASELGGGIQNTGIVTLDGSDVTNNTASNSGGISNGPAVGANLTIQNGSIISGNTSTDVACGCAGGLVNHGHAIFDMDASTIDGNNADSGAGLSNFGIGAITNSTVSNNVASGFGGGGILNAGKLTIDGSTISGNSADVGGGINNGEGTLTITNSTITGNDGDGGGGVVQFGPGLTTIKDSTISGNTAATGGAGVRLNEGGTVNILRTEISGNVAASGGGGAIHSHGSTTVNLAESTISGNSADEGGGLFNGAVATIVNSTFSGNSSTTGGAGVATVEPDAVTSVRSSTITNNVGPGIGSEGLTSIKNTIVANSTGGSDCDGTLTSAGFNLIENPGGGCNIAGNLSGNIVGQDPNLAPLADYGGPTLTHELLVGSPAFEAGSPSCPPPDTDQRGVPRPQFFRCDIGATESEELLGIVDVTVNDPATLTPTGRVIASGTIYCGPSGDTFRVFVQADQDSTGAITRIGAATGTCSGEPGDPWTVTLRRRSGSPPFQPGEVQVCFEARTLQGTTVIDRFTGCATVGLET